MPVVRSETIRRSARRGGFSLVEIAFATAIIGIGITALLVSVGAGTRSNDAGQKLTQATFLAQEIREWSCKLPFSDTDLEDKNNPPGPDSGDVGVDDLDDLMNLSYTPPRDAAGQPIADMVGWSQKITMTWRNPSDLAQTVTAGSSDVVNVQVDVLYHNKNIMTTSWIVARRY